MKRFGRASLLMALTLIVVVMSISSSADAVPILKLSDGTTTVVITDEGVNDVASGMAGSVGYAGPIGNFTLNITTAVTKPVVGLPTAPFMDIASFNTTNNGGAGTLTMTYSDIDYTASPPMIALGHIGGTIGTGSQGSVRYVTYLGESNTLFEMSHVLSDTGVLTGNPFGASDFSLLPLSIAAPYSLTMEVTITHLGEGNTSFDAELELFPQPEPSTLFLLSSGLAGLAFWGRRRLIVVKR